MKKVIAAVMLAVVALIGFLVYQGQEKTAQKDIYEEAAVFFEEEDYKKAIQYFEEAREHDNLFSGDLTEEIQYYKAEAHMKLGETEEALDIYNHFIGKNPKETMNYILKGHCLVTAEAYDEAYICYQEAFEQTGDGDFLVRLCDMNISMNEYEKALEIIADNSGLEDEDALKELRFLEIVIYEKQMKYDEAYEKVLEFCEQYPEDELGQKERIFLESR